MSQFKFCSSCGGALEPRRVASEVRNHAWCPQCAQARYQHPMIVVTCFVACGNRLLWVQRALEPKRGLWAIPGGYMEAGETLAEGAARELYEEAGVVIPAQELQLYMTGTITFINQIYVAFRACVDTPECTPGVESLQAEFYTREQCPWEQVAYPEVNDCIVQAYDDLDSGSFRVWQAEMTPGRYELWPVDTALA